MKEFTTLNALAQNVNRILSVLGGQSFRQCLSTSEKSIIFSNVRINGLTHFYQCFSWARLGLDKAQFWANPFIPLFLLGWTWARFGLSHFFQCFSWDRLGLDKAQFWANPFFPMFLLGWTWARFGLSHSSPAKTLAAAVAVLRTCVEDEALGGLMSPRLITDLDVLAP